MGSLFSCLLRCLDPAQTIAVSPPCINLDGGASKGSSRTCLAAAAGRARKSKRRPSRHRQMSGRGLRLCRVGGGLCRPKSSSRPTRKPSRRCRRGRGRLNRLPRPHSRRARKRLPSRLGLSTLHLCPRTSIRATTMAMNRRCLTGTSRARAMCIRALRDFTREIKERCRRSAVRGTCTSACKFSSTARRLPSLLVSPRWQHLVYPLFSFVASFRNAPALP